MLEALLNPPEPELEGETDSDFAPRDFVLRTYGGTFIHSVRDIIIANQLARGLGVKVKVFKRTPEGEVLMSYNGPKDWD